MKTALNREYKSQTTMFGLPLVHVVGGRDPITGKKRIARGIIAVGNVAVGFVAIGGAAVGGVTIGGVSLGVISLGGLSIGMLLALGGCALGAGLSCGGLAVSTIALGGMAVGYYAIGGGVAGMHTVSALGTDPEVGKLLQPSTIAPSQRLAMLVIFSPLACLIGLLIFSIGFLAKARPLAEQATLFDSSHERKPI